MTPLTPLRMLLSSHHGWDEIANHHASTARSFFRIVLPASLFAAAMLLYAAYFNGEVYAPQVPLAQWQAVIVLFLLLIGLIWLTKRPAKAAGAGAADAAGAH